MGGGSILHLYGLDIINERKLQALKVSAVGNPAMPPPFPSVPLQVPTIIGALPGATALATSFMKGWMSKANMPTIQELIEVTLDGGGKLFACTTTMGVMGVEEGDLIEGVSCLGAAAFLDFAADADVAMFI